MNKITLIVLNLLLVILLTVATYTSGNAKSQFNTESLASEKAIVGFNKTTPANGAIINVPTSSYLLLQWTDALIPSADRYQYCIDQTNNNTCDSGIWVTRNSLYSGGPGDIILEPSKTYYWQVRVRDAGVYANGGTWWSFTTSNVVPSFNKTTPANGVAISMPANTYYLLTWTNLFLPSTDRYQYCIDETNNNTCDTNSWITRNSLYSGTGEFALGYGKTYYWQVRSRDSGIYANSGAWWSFSILAAPVTTLNKTNPANGAVIALPASTYYLLKWTDLFLPSTDRYQYCIDETNNNSCDANNWITRNSLYSGTGEFSLAPGKTYYWQVRSRDSLVYADAGAWHSFTISGAVAALNKTAPGNAAVIALPASTYYLLTWTNLFLPSTDRYQYCIDETNNNTCDTNSWITRNSLYSGTGEFPVALGKTYYWQVRSRDSLVYADAGAWHSFTISGVAPTLNKTTPANGASLVMPASTYYLLQWTNLFLPSTDRYQYCIDQTNNDTCDTNSWITRNSLFSGPEEFLLEFGKTYYWQVRARDAGIYADGGAWRSFTIQAVAPAPMVVSIVRTTPPDATPIADASVTYTITFDQAVTGVDVSDFVLTVTGVSGASIVSVGGVDNTNTRTITVNTGSGDGTIRLDFVDNDSVKNNQTTPVGGVGAGNGSFISGEVYTIDKP